MEGPQGRHVRDALVVQRQREADALVAVSRPAVDPDRVRRLFEQIGALYGRLQLGDEYGIGAIEEQGVEEFADFLDTVYRAVRNPGGNTAAALRAALHRYEHARNPGPHRTT